MSEKQYEKFIMSGFNTEKDEIGTCLYMLDDKKVSGLSFFTECAWVWPKDRIVMEDHAHTHDFNEIVTVFGTNPDDPQDLCGEVEFWFDDEKYVLTKSSIIYIPKGIKHCPMIFTNVTRPIFHYLVGDVGGYSR